MQIVWSSRHGSRKIEHLGSAHDEAGVGLGERSAAEPLPITSSKSSLLWDALCAAYARVGSIRPPAARRCFASWCW